MPGAEFDVCIAPHGDDTWHYNVELSGVTSDDKQFIAEYDSQSLTEATRCEEHKLPNPLPETAISGGGSGGKGGGGGGCSMTEPAGTTRAFPSLDERVASKQKC